jgi:hypothetical protein
MISTRVMASLVPALVATVMGCHPARVEVPPPTDGRWKPIASTPGAFRLDVVGAPDRPGDFVYLLKVPAGLAVPGHTHSTDLTARVREGHQIILVRAPTGTSVVHELREGQSYRIAANALHEERFPEASIIELRGRGPLTTARPQ